MTMAMNNVHYTYMLMIMQRTMGRVSSCPSVASLPSFPAALSSS